MTKEEYLLLCLGEECSELNRECIEALRFGINTPKPHQPKYTAEKAIIERYTNIGVLVDKLKSEGLILIDENTDKIKRNLNYNINNNLKEARKNGIVE